MKNNNISSRTTQIYINNVDEQLIKLYLIYIYIYLIYKYVYINYIHGIIAYF